MESCEQSPSVSNFCSPFSEDKELISIYYYHSCYSKLFITCILIHHANPIVSLNRAIIHALKNETYNPPPPPFKTTTTTTFLKTEFSKFFFRKETLCKR